MDKKKRVWPFFLISLIFPIIGGLATYFMKKDKDKQLAELCLSLSILNPTLFSWIFDYFFSDFGILFTLAVSLAFCWYFLRGMFKKNAYRYFVPTFYFSFIGAILSERRYKKNAYMLRNVRRFWEAQVILAIISILIVAIAAYMYISAVFP